MKKFIQHIFIFSGLVLFIAAGVGLFNYSKMKVPPDLGGAEILFVGDSRVMTAINPDSIPHSKNIAQNTESYFISYHKLKLILAHNKSIKKVFLGFSYHNFSAYVDNIFKDDMATEDIFNRVYPLVQPGDFGTIPIDKYKYYKILLKQVLIYPHNNHQKYLGKFEALPYGLDKANLQSVIMRHYYDKDSNNIGTSSYASSYLDSIIRLTHEKDVKLILVNIPLQQKYFEKIPNNFIQYYDDQKLRLQKMNLEVLDYGSLQLPDRYFKDYNHLDLDGANFFTEMLKQDLRLK